MHLFTRQATLARDQIQDGIAYAVDIAAYVSEKTGLEVNAWTTVYGGPLGSVSWSSRVDSQAAMGAATDALVADAGFQERVAANVHRFDGPLEDSIGEFVALTGEPGPVRQYAGIVTAQCAAGKIADAMAWGVDIMQLSAKLTGTDHALVRPLYGPFATLVWIALFDTLEEADLLETARASDPTYLERLDQGGDLFVPGSATQRLIRRLS
jgi:hypothetical protein